MTLTRVKSTNVTAIGYDAEAHRAIVMFTSGAAYCYAPVDAERHERVMAAKSKGAAVRTYLVLDRAIICERLTPEEAAGLVLVPGEA